MSEHRTRGQRGRSKATLNLIDTCIEIIEPVQPITVRGVCYRLFVAGQIKSMAVNNTQKISRLLTRAREEGLIPWEWIVDDSRRMEGDAGFRDLSEYAENIAAWYRRDFWAAQPRRVIVISEKATVAGILRPVLGEYGVPFLAVHGFNSATKMHDLAEEISRDERLTVLLYVGDYDPSGLWMSVQDLPDRLADYGAGVDGDDYTFRRVALTHADVQSGNLTPFDAETKKKDPRYRWFVSHYGEKAWELDAMDPNELRDRVRGEIEQYVNADDWEQHQRVEAAQKETVNTIATRMAATL
ncbi:MAG TPA: hypothetical protein VGK77_04555 [Candidatus Binatia bacterium]|jgi:hypothetical protein